MASSVSVLQTDLDLKKKKIADLRTVRDTRVCMSVCWCWCACVLLYVAVFVRAQPLGTVRGIAGVTRVALRG